MSAEFIKPKIVNQEIFLDSGREIISKTDKFGIIEYANDYFMEISGYEEYELMGRDMYCVQHPDMPQVIFKHMWEKLLSHQNFQVVVKNLTKSGKFYWSYTNFTFKVNEQDDEIKAIFSKEITATKESVEYFSKLYKTLVAIEKKNNIQTSEKYIIGFLEEKQTDFNGLVNSFYKKNNKEILIKPKEKSNQAQKLSLDSTNKAVITSVKSQENTPLNNPTKEEDIPNTKSSKGIFQKLFGKTDKEIEADKLWKKKK